MVQLDENLVDTLLQKLDTKLDEKLAPIQEKLTKLEEGQVKLENGQKSLEEGQKNLEGGLKRIEAKLNKEVEDMAENIGIIMAKMPDGEKINKRLDRIEDELHLSPIS